ncbi:MobF family relaxase [Nocardia sp. NPDC050713]|uniref:MobF family relaxase n=1 Tax=Nocardia sp. NPDC050713 TaxID=3154511 RepID=UPI0033C276CE
MVMTLARLASGDGYEYYLRNIATHDVNDRGSQNLAGYYSERGESPGRWMGSGLSNVGLSVGDPVTEPQMRALFGRGLHPNAEAMIVAEIRAQMREGVSKPTARAHATRLARLGQPFSAHIVDEYSYRYECTLAYEAYNLERGRVGHAPIPEIERQTIRTEVATRMFTEEHGRGPLNDRELSGWVARASRPSAKRVAGYDLTFTPVKSVSALWALAPREVAEQIEAAHYAAIDDTLAYLEKHAIYTRVGRHSRRQVEVEGGLIATAYDHRDSRAGDPNLHTHVVVSSMVKRKDGQWGSLDSRMLYKHNVPASELYNTRLEHHLEARLGLRFAQRPGGRRGKRPIREIVGIDQRLSEEWSQRSKVIKTELDRRARRFQAGHGREPTPLELLDLGQEATLVTRGAKVPARSRAEQRAAWRADAEALLGGPDAVAAMVATALGQAAPVREATDAAWVAQTANTVVQVVSESRATWQARHIRTEAERQLRGRVAPQDWARLITEVTDTALSAPYSIPRGTPDAAPAVGVLARSDGTSVYTTAGSLLHTSPQIVDAEQRLITASLRSDGRTVPAAAVDTAIVEHAANHDGQVLNAGQQALVREFATSGRRFQVGLAPAGTGKTTATATLTTLWTSEGGNVVGLAPTGSAAAELARSIGVHAATVDMLVELTTALTEGRREPDDVPEWVRSIGPQTLVILDEAAKTPTLKLDSAVTWLLERGASVRAVGDDRQLASVAAGGVIRDIVHHAGASTLTNVVRFTDPAERAASLALREGDPAAIAYYSDHDRIHVGVLGAVVDDAFRAWARDHARGLDAALLAPTHQLVGELNARARAARLHRDGGVIGAEVVLADGLSASAGDLIVTRSNNYKLWISKTDHVRNGYRWQVRAVLPDGRVSASHLGSGRLVVLPADYVREHTQLGYATTIDSAQGLTVDTCHGVLTGRESRAQLYVLASRARDGSHLYLATAGTGEESDAYTYTALHPPTAIDMLTDILGRDGTQTSATTQAREDTDPRRQLAGVVDAYFDALAAAADDHLGAEHHTGLAAAAERLVPGLTGEQAWPVLRQHLVLLALSGRDPVAALTDAVAARELDSADDRAAVLDWRIGRVRTSGPLGWLPEIPPALRTDDTYGEHLRTRETQIRDMAAQITRTARAWTADSAPTWAQPLTGAAPGVVAQLAVWRAAHDVPDHDRRPTGPTQYPVDERAAQAHLDKLVRERLGDLDADTRRWTRLTWEVDDRIATDPYWPQLASELTRAARTGADVPASVREAAAGAPLPDEQPAAALRWRLTELLDADPDRDFTSARDELARMSPQALRRLSDAELDDRAHELRAALREPSMPLVFDFAVNNAREDLQHLRDWHQRLDRDAVAIRHAQALADTALKIAREQQQNDKDQKASTAARDRTNWLNYRARAAHQAEIDWLKEKRRDIDQRLARAEADAKAAARATATPRQQWAQTLADATNQASRDAALRDAHARLARAERDRDRHDAAQARDAAELRTIDAEQTRRADLSDQQRSAEERARDDLTDTARAQASTRPTRPERERREKQQQQRAKTRNRWTSPDPHLPYDNGPSHGHGYGL